MNRENIKDEQNRVIGYTMTEGNVIHYFTYKYGQVGQYDTASKLYRRWKTRPGQVIVPFPGTDYGLSDVLYWSEH